MEGNVVKAAWVLGGSLVLSTVLAGVGLLAGTAYFGRQFYEHADLLSKRSAEAVLDAPKNTTVHFDSKIPMAVRLENGMDEKRGARAVFEIEVKPTLNK